MNNKYLKIKYKRLLNNLYRIEKSIEESKRSLSASENILLNNLIIDNEGYKNKEMKDYLSELHDNEIYIHQEIIPSIIRNINNIKDN